MKTDSKGRARSSANRPAFRCGMALVALVVFAGCEDETDRWSRAVDAFWGAAPDESTRLAIFDDLWGRFSEEYAAFVTTDIDWNAVREAYRPKVARAESYGRFYQLLTEIFAKLQDAHTQIESSRVCGTPVAERPPYFRTVCS